VEYQYEQFLAEDFSQLCRDLKVSETSSFYAEAWADGIFFIGFATNGESYLVRIPDPAPDDIRVFEYLFKFEGRAFIVAAKEMGDEAWVRDSKDLNDCDKQRVAEHLVAAFCVNGYFGAGSWDQAGELQIRWT